MPRLLPMAFVLAALLVAACGPSPTQIAVVESTRVAGEFPITPMQLVIVRGKKGALVLALDKDGLLRDGKEAVGAVKGARVLGTKGEERVAVLGDGRVTWSGRRTPLRFERDELVSDNGKRISVDDAGNVVFAPPMRRKLGYSFRFDGFAAPARRTALLVLMLVVLENEKEATVDDE